MIKPFYVYRIFNITGTLYVGKGSGNRLRDQKRRFGADGEIVAEFASEAAAYHAERRFIRKLKPTENKHPGGNGSWCGQERNYPVQPHGFSEEGLPLVASALARILWRARKYPRLMELFLPYAKAHGTEKVLVAIRPHLKHLQAINW